MKSHHQLYALLVCLATFVCTNVHGETRQPARRDTLRPAEPGQVTMRGYLGQRMTASRDVRLLRHVTDEHLLAGFQNRPGSHPWMGEYVGKWLSAACLALRNSPEQTELRDKIGRIAKALMACQLEDGYLGTYAKKDQWASRVQFGDETRGGWDVWVHRYCLIGLLSYYDTTGDEEALSPFTTILAHSLIGWNDVLGERGSY